MSEQKPVRRPRHLMDPSNPQRMAASTDRSLSNVQKWVMSTLAVTTILHLSGGLIVFAGTFPDDKVAAKVGLLVIATIFSMFAVAAGMAVHQKNPISPWILLGLVPSLVALPILF